MRRLKDEGRVRSRAPRQLLRSNRHGAAGQFFAALIEHDGVYVRGTLDALKVGGERRSAIPFVNLYGRLCVDAEHRGHRVLTLRMKLALCENARHKGSD